MRGYKYIFICGTKRSGTTVITSLLDGHPELFVYPGEFQVFGKSALGDFLPNEEYPVSSYLEKLSWYFDYVRKGGKEYETKFDIDRVLKKLSTMNKKMNRMDFLNLLSHELILDSGLDDSTIKYVAVKTMYNGVDFSDSKVFRHMKLLPYRDKQDLISSYRTKFIKKEHFFSYKLIGNFFFQNLLKARVQGDVLINCRLSKNCITLPLDLLKAEPGKTMIRVSEMLDIAFIEGLLRTTYGGKSWGGHFYDNEKNEGKVVNKKSNYYPLLPLEKWALSVLAEKIEHDGDNQLRFGFGLSAGYIIKKYIKYLPVSLVNFAICFVDMNKKIFKLAVKGKIIFLLKYPFYFFSLTVRHTCFFSVVMFRKLFKEIDAMWGINSDVYYNKDIEYIK